MNLLYIANIRIPTEKAHGLQIMKTCEAFAAQKIQIELVVPTRINSIKEDSFEYYAVQQNFKIHFVKVFDWINLGKIGFFLSALSFSEVAHFRKAFWKADAIYSRDALVLFQYILLGRPLVYEAHQKPTFVSKVVARRAKRVVVISHGLKDAYIKAGVSSKKIIVAPDGIDLKTFENPELKEQARTRLGLRTDTQIAMYIGRLDGWKGVDTLCEAGEMLSKNSNVDSKIQVVIIGGEPEQVFAFQKKYPNVTFLGYRPYTELADNQAAADVLVLPNTAKDIDSALYTSPLKLFSYMGSNRPIVASDLPSIREVLGDEDAYFAKPDDPNSFVNKIEQIFREPERAMRKAHRSKELVINYSWESRVKNIISSMQYESS